MNLVVGRITTHPRGFGFVVPDRPSRTSTGDIYVAGSNLNQAMHGDRVVARVERVTRQGRRRPDPAHPRTRRGDDRRPLRGRRLRRRVRRPVRSTADHGRADSARRAGRRQVRRHGRRPTSRAGRRPPADRSARSSRCLATSTSRRRHRNHHPQARHPRRAQRGGDRGSAQARSARFARRTSPGEPTSDPR